MTPQLSIVVPCFNPPPNWATQLIYSFNTVAEGIEGEVELVLVFDGRSLSLAEKEVQQIRKQVPHVQYCAYEQNKGKGYAIREGMELAKGKFFIFTDIDFPYPNNDVVGMYKVLEQGDADLVIATRDSNYYKSIHPTRKRISKVFKGMIKLLFRIPTTDTQAGLKGFSEAGRAVLLQTTINRYLFDLELVKLAAKQKIKIVNQAVSLKEGVVLSSMSYGILFKELINLVRIFFR